MPKTYMYFQPEYVSKFKCDGQSCKAYCCRYWNIEIDKRTYKKYSHVKPKAAAKEIIQHIKKSVGGGRKDITLCLTKKKVARSSRRTTGAVFKESMAKNFCR